MILRIRNNWEQKAHGPKFVGFINESWQAVRDLNKA
jgi:hypothetical protein